VEPPESSRDDESSRPPDRGVVGADGSGAGVIWVVGGGAIGVDG
jgi:hypothetical protein